VDNYVDKPRTTVRLNAPSRFYPDWVKFNHFEKTHRVRPMLLINKLFNNLLTIQGNNFINALAVQSSSWYGQPEKRNLWIK